jgi:hypothetical protein
MVVERLAAWLVARPRNGVAEGWEGAAKVLFAGRVADDPAAPTKLLVTPVPLNLVADEADKVDSRDEP